MLTLCIFLCIRYIQLCRLPFFLVTAWVFIHFEFGFWVFKGIGFTFYNYITYFASFIIAFCNSLCCVFSESRRSEYPFKIFESSLAFNYFCLCLVFLWFCPCFQVLLDFSLFMRIVLDYFYCSLRRMLGFLTHTHIGKITVSETQNNSNAHTHTQTMTKHIKYQRGVEKTKEDTLRKERMTSI